MQNSATKKRGALRNILMWGFHLVVKWIGGVKDIQDTQCGFKLFTRNTGMIFCTPLINLSLVGKRIRVHFCIISFIALIY